MCCRNGSTTWLTGLPCSGKSTIAYGVEEALAGARLKVEVLDGDVVRSEFFPELGFSEVDRRANIARIARLALMLARNGATVVVPVIAPYANSRGAARALHEVAGIAFSEVFVYAPLDVCMARDVKGLYARYASGEVKGLTGLDSPYESPSAAELRLDTHLESIDRCVSAVCRLVRDRT
jgi:adenylylsulfate kinase